MNSLDGFILGYILGIITTFIGIMLFTKYMSKAEKEKYMALGKEKLNKK